MRCGAAIDPVREIAASYGHRVVWSRSKARGARGAWRAVVCGANLRTNSDRLTDRLAPCPRRAGSVPIAPRIPGVRGVLGLANPSTANVIST